MVSQCSCLLECATNKGTKRSRTGTNGRSLQVSEGDEGGDVEVVDIHGTGGDVRSHGLEILIREELGLDLGRKDFGVLLKERNNNSVIILLHVLLLKLELKCRRR